LFPNSEDGNIMLIDFGLSFKWNYDMKTEMEMSGANKIVGTSYYVSPEILNKNYDERCDIWALGILLHIMTTATAPFTGDTDEEILHKIRTTRFK
jgi:calcium-dependent protein kinase